MKWGAPLRRILSGGLSAEAGDTEGCERLSHPRLVNAALLLAVVLEASLALAGDGPLRSASHAALSVLLAVLFLLLRRFRKPAIGGVAILAALLGGQLVDLAAAGGSGWPRVVSVVVSPVAAFLLLGPRGGLIAMAAFLSVQVAAAAASPPDAAYPIQPLVAGLCAGGLALLAAAAHQRLSRMMAHELTHDRLTGLPNRAVLLQDAAARSEPALLLVNLDDFKTVNMLFGYRTGDSVLRFVGTVLKSTLARFGATVYRLAGDEFAVMFDPGRGAAARSATERAAREAHDGVGHSRFDAAGTQILLRVSVGAALAEESGRDRLLPAADAALKSAKQARRPYVVSGSGDEDRSFLEADMRQLQVLNAALTADRVVPFYQPIVSTATGEVMRFECLVRLLDERGGIVSPGRFLGVAKRSRLYPKITLAMLRRTFAAFEDTDIEFAINLSAGDFVDPYVLQFVDLAVTQYPAVARRLWFEILESEGLDNFEQAREFIARMKKLGCRIALDDFGSGYSNFESVLRLDLDCVKIDGSLIRRIDSDSGARVLVENIVGFSRRLGLSTVAEYVHSRPVYDVVRDMGIDYSQGYLFGEPLPAIDEAIRTRPRALDPA